MGKMQRTKGANGEREVANQFKRLGFIACRSVGQTFSGGNDPDVKVEGLPHLWVEVKRGKKTNIRAALKQAREASKPHHWPIAVTRDDFEEKAVVSMSFDVFGALLKKAFPEHVQQTDLEDRIEDDGHTYSEGRADGESDEGVSHP